MPNGDVYELTLHTQHDEQTGVIRRYYRQVNTTGTGPSQALIAGRFGTQWPVPLKNCMSAQAAYEGLKVSRVLPVPRTRASIDVVGAGAGASAADSLPRQSRGIITLRTAFAGPGYRGRIYVPFPSEAFNTVDGVPTAAYITALDVLATVATATQVGIGGAGNQADLIPIIWHLPTGSPNDPTLRVAYDLTDFLSRGRWATQRRSGSYGRPNVSALI